VIKLLARKIVGVVVAFNPDVAQIRLTVQALAGQVETVFLLDNSDNGANVAAQLADFPTLRYIGNNGNQGIAQALNRALHEAKADGAGWLLTLDQDSSLPAGYVGSLATYLDDRVDGARIGVLGAAFSSSSDDGNQPAAPSGEVEYLITSGNLLNVDAALSVGGFREDFFIDYVDVEMCFRLRRRGFKVVQHPSLIFAHELGAIKRSRFLRWSFVASHHSAARRYYMTRNRLVFYAEYFGSHRQFVLTDATHMLKEIFKIFLVEDRKLVKVKAITLGIVDVVRGKMGKAPHRF